MCGILVQYKKEGFNTDDLIKQRSALTAIDHRGPDGEGMVLINAKTNVHFELKTTEQYADCNNSNVLLAHKRLSIIDPTPAGHQPMEAYNSLITFNGEIYNYIEIREELKKLGYNFKTDSDTEVILAAYSAWKEKCLNKFNGMFSFALYDLVTNSIFIANDRFGVKPLYYYQNSTGFILASEIKQFYKFEISLSLNEKNIKTFLFTQYIDHNNDTFYNEINRFPKGSYCVVKLNSDFSSLNFHAYYNLPTSVISRKDYLEEFNSLFTDSVKLRLRSDVPLGFASSGGLDSSSILYKAHAILKSQNNQSSVNTFSAVFPGMDGDESEFIQIIEKDLELRSHYTNPLELFSIADFEAHVFQQDLPVNSTSYYAEWCVSRLVNQSGVKVLLIGQGGDELLAGYHHHFYRYCRSLILHGKIFKYLSEVKAYAEIKSVDVNYLHRTIINEIKLIFKLKIGLQTINDDLEKHWSIASKLIDILKIDFSATMLPTFLRSDDRDAMAFGLETRHPFLDYRLVDFCFSMPDDLKIKNGWQKNILRECMTELPEKIRYRKDKKGYTTPESEWIKKYQTEFDDYLSHIPEQFKKYRSSNTFLNYALGAWFKVNNIS